MPTTQRDALFEVLSIQNHVWSEFVCINLSIINTYTVFVPYCTSCSCNCSFTVRVVGVYHTLFVYDNAFLFEMIMIMLMILVLLLD